jgi:two-component system response regulator YesN
MEINMYRTLIVDDEPLMRQYLNANLSEICPSFAVTGIACDGLEAVELLQKQDFDLVITDIRMPEMDGLNLSKYIFRSAPGTTVIIISGYNEFEYARSAIRYGVADYLLKPLSDDSMKDTLQKIKADLDKLHSRDVVNASPPHYNQSSDYELCCALLSALLNNNELSVQNIYNVLQERNISFARASSCIMLLCLDELHLLLQERKSMENSSCKLEFYQRCRQYCSSRFLPYSMDDKGHIFLLLTAASADELALLARTVYQEVKDIYWRKEALRIVSSFGHSVDDFLNLSSSCSSAVESLALTLKNVPSPIAPNYYLSQSKFLNELKTICDALYYDFISRNTNKMITDLYLYIALFQDEISIASIIRYGTYLLRYLVNKCNIRTDYIQPAFRELTDNIDRGIRTDHFDRESTHALYLKMLKLLDHNEVSPLIPETMHIVESAKEYICTHYNEPISLAIIADSLKVNPSYLSDLFHRNIGEPYTKFLTRIRMEQALLLLKSNPSEKIYVIAEKTGFASPKHFNAVFKKFYGFTPTDYINDRKHSR